ncbi:ATP-binding protein [Psychrosphaera haliotis]|uniref:histidine kinase n=1 Tax=Psychrosphaera haliotis TaxID=555083 RepID=A0A6N8FA76_9GAMM|nr:ATP-binding protein [Psychrosphaera haliotis]MUH73353.1 HAMP domain-containing protein [Psychrosphaera haliotis]
MARLNSLLFKVFAWFWSSIAITIVILLLISSVSFTDLVSKPLDSRKIRGIEKYALFIEKRFNSLPTSKQLQRLLHRSSRKRVLFLKGSTSEMSVLSGPVPESIDLNLLAEVDDLTPQYIFTENYHAIGPIKVKINNEVFHLYEVTPKRNPPLLIKFSLLPIWLKFTVPILVSLGLSFLFTRGIARPIRELRDAAEKVGKGELSSRVPNKYVGKDELGELSADFNSMAEQLEASMGVQRRLLADISHELRSPLTRLSLAVGLAKESNEERREGYLARIEKEAEQLDQMIGSVLMLSRLETKQQHLDLQEYVLSDVLIPVLQDAEFEAESLGKKINIEALPNLNIRVDRKIVSSAIENILRNGIRYAKSQITFEAKVEGNKVQLIIEDDGLGIPDHLLSKISEPFYRHSDARERNSGGAGLGLAIAKKAMTAHSGYLLLSNKPTGGLSVELVFNSLAEATQNTQSPKG